MRLLFIALSTLIFASQGYASCIQIVSHQCTSDDHNFLVETISCSAPGGTRSSSKEVTVTSLRGVGVGGGVVSTIDSTYDENSSGYIKYNLNDSDSLSIISAGEIMLVTGQLNNTSTGTEFSIPLTEVAVSYTHLTLPTICSV